LTKSGQAFLVDTAAMATRARVQKGIDSVAVAGLTGSGTTNYVAKFTGTKALGNSAIWDAGSAIGINTTTPGFNLDVLGNGRINANAGNGYAFHVNDAGSNVNQFVEFDISKNTGAYTYYRFAGNNQNIITWGRNLSSYADALSLNSPFGLVDIQTGGNSRIRTFSNGNIGIGTSTDAGYKTDISGTLRSTLGANFATTSGNVGVGLTSPQSKLHISGDLKVGSSTQNGLIGLGDVGGSSSYVGIFRGGANTIGGDNWLNVGGYSGIAFTTGENGILGTQSERMRITYGGNVGIGTTSPTEKLDVTSTQSRIVVTSTTNGNNSGVYFNAKNSGGTNVQGGVYFIPAATPYLSLSGDNSGVHLNVTSAGNVGVGTASPQSKFSVVVPFVNNGDVGTIIGGQTLSTSLVNIQTVAENVGNGATSMSFGTYTGGVGVSEKMRITSSGNVGIGTASPSEKLHISRSDAGDIAMLASNSVSSNYFITRASGNAEILTTSGAIQFSTNGGEDMRISTSGELLINSTSDAGDYKLQVAGSIYNTTGAVLAASSGALGVSVVPKTWNSSFNVMQIGETGALFSRTAGVYQNGILQNAYFDNTDTRFEYLANSSAQYYVQDGTASSHRWYTAPSGTANNALTFTERMNLSESGELYVGLSGAPTDAGDYKLQVNGNERIAGKLDVITTTEYGVNLGRSGTSATAFQAYNSTAAMAVGIESSTGGGLFTGTSAYAAVFGNANNYPTQFVTNNTLRATISAAGEILVGTTSDQGAYALQVNGSVYNTGQVTRGAFNLIGTGAQFSTDSTTNLSPVYLAGQSLTGSSAQGLIYGNATWNTSGTPSLIDINLTNTSSSSDANYIKITDGTNTFRVTKSAEVVTAAPTGGSIRKWKLGEAATVSPTSPNRTIRVEIDGTVYYLHAKTTND
jgi:hypothetical protein